MVSVQCWIFLPYRVMLSEQKILLFLLYATSVLSTLCIFMFHTWLVQVPSNLIIVHPSDAELNEMSRKLPDCIIIGVKNGGASALLDIIGVHPDVEIAVEDINFFNQNNSFQKGLEWYSFKFLYGISIAVKNTMRTMSSKIFDYAVALFLRAQMPATNDKQLTVEKSDNYFNSKIAPKRILKFNNKIKLILAVRDPTERAISDYVQSYSMTNKSFEDLAFVNKTNTVNPQWLPIQTSQYALHMRRWLKHFPLAQFLLVEFSELSKEPQEQMQRVEIFLGLRPYYNLSHFYIDSTKGCMSWHRSRTPTKDSGKGLCLDHSEDQTLPFQVNHKSTFALRKYFEPLNLKFFDQIELNYNWLKNKI